MRSWTLARDVVILMILLLLHALVVGVAACVVAVAASIRLPWSAIFCMKALPGLAYGSHRLS